MSSTILVAAALATTIACGVATASPTAKRQRIAISFQSQSGTFVLTPLTSGPVRPDSGTYASCCWTRRRLIRDGELIEIDDPTVVLTGKRGTFTWRERLVFAASNNDYTVATGVWTITRGTGAYAHLEGHGREAAVTRTAEDQEVAAEAEGLVDLRR